MSLTNIFIVVDTKNIVAEPDGKITDPEKVIKMYDDQSTDPDQGTSELSTFATAGDLLTWFIVAKDVDAPEKPLFVKVEDTSPQTTPLFNNNNNIAPIIYYNGLRCVAAISDAILPKKEKKLYSYQIYFSLGDKVYYWDPFIETRDDNEE